MRMTVTTKRWLGALCGGLLALTCPAASVARAAEGISGQPPDLRVCVTLDVTGELVASTGRDTVAIREPVEMAARFDFEESAAASLPDGETAGPAGGSRLVARRHYREATASMHIGDVTTNTELAADARHLLVARRGTTPLPYLANGFLSGEEFDLLDTPFDSVLIEDILPQTPMVVGQSWEIPGDVTAGLLSIDTVESGVIEARIEEVSDASAIVVIAGIIDGAVDGVPTHLTVEGSLRVPARNAAPTADVDEPSPQRHELYGRVTQVSVLLKERRQASHVAPGFEVEARVLVERTAIGQAVDRAAVVGESLPQTEVAAESASAIGGPAASQRRPGVGEPDRVWYRESADRFDLVHDTRWRRVEDGPNGLVMRLVDRGALLGQCSITSLPQAPASALPTREDLQRDIERSLAGQVVRVEAGEETDRGDGLRIVRLVSTGTAGSLPFRWIHYVIVAADGRRVSVTFMFEESMLQRFAEADRPLIEGLRLPSGPSAGQSSPEDPAPPGLTGPTAALPDAASQQTR